MAISRKSGLPNLTERLAALVAPLLPTNSSILLGLSGGVDSVVLLHVLHSLAPRFAWQLSALHVHHGISPQADAWAAFCADLCAQYGIPLHTERVDIAPLRAHGIEAAARKLRHAAFASQPCDVVALAHHADDQAETLLLQLLRGAGVRGAAAMPMLTPPNHRPLNESTGWLKFIRPLLYCTRQEILDFAATHHLPWIEDESNTDEHYPRNFLRQRLLPLLNNKFPAYRATLSRSAQHFAEASRLLDELAQQDMHSVAPQPVGERQLDVVLETAQLQALTTARAKNLLRYYLHSQGANMPQVVQLDEMLQQLCSASADAAICISFGAWQLRRYRGRVYVLPVQQTFDAKQVLVWDGEAALAWPASNQTIHFIRTAGAGISVEKLQGAPVTLRLRKGGEKLRPQPLASTRSLRNLLQEHSVPPWQRDRLPLLFSGDNLVCVPGVAISSEYRADGHESAIQIELQATV